MVKKCWVMAYIESDQSNLPSKEFVRIQTTDGHFCEVLKKHTKPRRRTRRTR